MKLEKNDFLKFINSNEKVENIISNFSISLLISQKKDVGFLLFLCLSIIDHIIKKLLI